MLLFSQIDGYYEQLFKELDIPDSYYEKAKTSYSSFNRWLGRDDSILRGYEPEIFLQGSFKLGTVIKPLGEDDSYDIDMVCKFNNLSKQIISQNDLKTLLGKEVTSYATSHGMIQKPKNGKRCWTLNYIDGAKFHMDILPCLDDSGKFIDQLETLDFAETTIYKEKAVAITDKRSKVYSEISNDWEISNPQGYFLWFQDQSNFIEKRAMLAEAFHMKAEELEEYKVKTPLQKTIQILKRHRDIMFKDNPDKKPSSIIIATLAGKSYSGGDNIRDVLKDVVENMHSHIEDTEGVYRVLNPVNPIENFADKWNDDRSLKYYYDNWIKEVKKTLTDYNNTINIYGEEFQKRISEGLGIPVSKAKSMVDDTQAIKIVNSIPHRQKLKWNMDELTVVHIIATKTKNGFSRPKIFQSGEFLAKNVDLRFEATAENIKQYEIHWQVTNTGADAKNNSCLRGEFCDGQIIEGKRIKKEKTSYIGTHLVECYLVKNGTCYGKSKPFIVNIKDGISFEW